MKKIIIKFISLMIAVFMTVCFVPVNAEGDYADTIEIQNNYLRMKVGDTVQLSYILGSNSDPDKTEFADEKVVWTAMPQLYDTGEVASVDERGNVTALKNGEYRIKAAITNGYSSTAYIEVAPDIEKIEFDANKRYMFRSDNSSLYLDDYLNVYPEEANVRFICYESSNSSVVEVEDERFLWVRGTGKTVITAYLPENPEIKATKEIEIYEPVQPESVRAVTPLNRTEARYETVIIQKLFEIEYEPLTADDETIWTSSDEDICKVAGSGVWPDTLYWYKEGTVTITAASVSNPELSVSFTLTITDRDLDPDSYTTDIWLGKRNEEDFYFYDIEVNPSVYTMETGETYFIEFHEESDYALPSVSRRSSLFNDSEILSATEMYNFMYEVDYDKISSRFGMILKPEKPGEETFTVGSKTFTIRVEGDEPADNKIREAFMTSEIYREPQLGQMLIWPEDMKVPAGSGYMTPEEYNETLIGQGVGDVCGAYFLGTIDNPEMRITWDHVVEDGDSLYFLFSLYAKQGYEFADDITVDFNGRKADKVVSSGSSLAAYFQYGPFEGDQGIQRIWFTMPEYEVPYGKQMVLIAHTDPEDAEDPITFTSSDENIVKMESNLVQAVGVGKATVTATAPNGVSASCDIRVQFTDVSRPDQYFYEPVYWAVDNGITVGAGGAGKFSPNNPCTREQIVTFLWRLMKEPEPKTESSFTDVKPDAWYYKPITWAYENGITTGLNDGTGRFGVGQACTREQCVTFLYRAAGEPPVTSHESFTDVAEGRYYYDSISWAASKKITVGLNDGTGRFGVGQKCTRAMIVTFLYRYNQTVTEAPSYQ